MKARSFTLVAAAILLSGVPTAAQRRLPPPVIAPMPPAPAPPAPAALTVPNPFAGLPGPRDLYRSPDGSDRFQHLSRYPAPVIGGPIYPGSYFPGPFDYTRPYYYGSPYNDFTIADTYRAVMAETYWQRQHDYDAARGSLVLESVPDGAQVFVDGNYVGLAEEFRSNGQELDVRAGVHTVEVRAPGYETLTFNVMIEPNRRVRYRGTMQTASTKPVAAIAPSQPAAAKNFYVIPNCYAGDKPPSGTLPKGCDRKNLQTRK